MEDARKLVEYGVPIDPQAMVMPPEAIEFELEAGHPGLGDETYVQRRRDLFARCRRHRLERLGPPLIEYTAEETRIWREVSPKLDELHLKHACQMYLNAKHELAINPRQIPQLRHLSERVERETNMHLVPAEGALPYRIFYQYIGARGFPVTQFIRHGSHPEFTPEPDMIHDCLGHVPPLMNHDYAELLTLIGKAVSATDSEPLLRAVVRRDTPTVRHENRHQHGLRPFANAESPVHRSVVDVSQERTRDTRQAIRNSGALTRPRGVSASSTSSTSSTTGCVRSRPR